ncbi:hypothetical protein D3C74_420190 [compost metagenome]
MRLELAGEGQQMVRAFCRCQRGPGLKRPCRGLYRLVHLFRARRINVEQFITGRGGDPRQDRSLAKYLLSVDELMSQSWVVVIHGDAPVDAQRVK